MAGGPGADGSRTLHVGVLARVEGEAAMHVRVEDGQVTDVELRIFEPPRFFEALLRGRAVPAPPDVKPRKGRISQVAEKMI